jgi:Universal stress protein family
MSLPGVPDGPVLFAYDGSEKAKAAIRQAGRRLCDGRRAIAVTVWTSLDQKPRRMADERDADIVVVGSHGRTGIIRLLLESISAATAGATDGPVLIVHAG